MAIGSLETLPAEQLKTDSQLVQFHRLQPEFQ
jgi:hypothetical protein